MKAYPLPEGEYPDRRFRILPPFRQSRNGLEVRVNLNETVVNEVDGTIGGGVSCESRVEGSGVSRRHRPGPRKATMSGRMKKDRRRTRS